MMTQKLVIGLGILISGLLVWNIWSIQSLESRLARLEAEAGFIADEVSAKRPAKQDIKTTAGASDHLTDQEQNGAAKAATSRSDQLDNTVRSKRSSDDLSEIKKTVGTAILELDDPEVKEAFDSYLNQYMKTWKDNQKDDDMSKFLDHMSTATEVFCEESGLTEDVREQIILKLEKAHEVWIANDVALEAGEIDRREYQEVDGRISKEVKSEMTELIGKDAWGKLSKRIWSY